MEGPNQSLWIVGFWVTFGLIIYGILKKRDKTTLFLTSGIIFVYVPYLLLQFTRRVMFPYYFILTVPFISLGVVLAMDRIRHDKLRVITKTMFLMTVVGWFVLFFPLKLF